MKEIGGYFGLDNALGREYYPQLQKLNTARNALIYLCRAKNIKKVYLPYFLCDSVAVACENAGVVYEQYPIYPDFTPNFSAKMKNGEWLYIVNYYGQISNERIAALQKQHQNVIVDNVQAFFQQPVAGVDTIYSCRKFFGVPDGAYLSTDAVLPVALEVDKSADRMRHILGRYEGLASDYYADFKRNDAAFRELPLMKMSLLTENLLRAIDYENAAITRNRNWNILHNGLGKQNKLRLTASAGPYAYPYYCKNGMALKKRLAEKKIFVATLWPNVLQMTETLEKDYAENILPLPCDQRYDAQDMETIIKAVLECSD